jgi:hypothetical protein
VPFRFAAAGKSISAAGEWKSDLFAPGTAVAYGFARYEQRGPLCCHSVRWCALNAAARNRMRRLVVDRFCISATRVTRLSAGLRRCAGANHQFLGWRFRLLFYGAATEFLARK